jgi:hypothetical protein
MEDKFKCKQVVSKVTTNYESLLDLLFVKVNSDVNIETDVVEAYLNAAKSNTFLVIDFCQPYSKKKKKKKGNPYSVYAHITLQMQCNMSSGHPGGFIL